MVGVRNLFENFTKYDSGRYAELGMGTMNEL
jgi:hypothetical protein